MNAIGSNHGVSDSRCAVFEMNDNGTALLVLQRINAFVEVCPLRRNAFDKLVEEVSTMHALLARGIELGVDELALMFAFALKKKIHGLVGYAIARKKMKLTTT